MVILTKQTFWFNCERLGSAPVEVSTETGTNKWRIIVNGKEIATAVWDDNYGFFNIQTTDQYHDIVRIVLEATEKAYVFPP
jgi:hypothetical protein